MGVVASEQANNPAAEHHINNPITIHDLTHNFAAATNQPLHMMIMCGLQADTKFFSSK
jgi:hypothetical protein